MESQGLVLKTLRHILILGHIWGIDNISKTLMHKMATKWKYCQRQWNYTQRFANLGSNQWMNNILCIKASLCRVSSMTCNLPCSKDYKHCCQVSYWDNRRSLKVEGLHVILPIRTSFESEGMCHMVHNVSHCYKYHPWSWHLLCKDLK